MIHFEADESLDPDSKALVYDLFYQSALPTGDKSCYSSPKKPKGYDLKKFGKSDPETTVWLNIDAHKHAENLRINVWNVDDDFYFSEARLNLMVGFIAKLGTFNKWKDFADMYHDDVCVNYPLTHCMYEDLEEKEKLYLNKWVHQKLTAEINKFYKTNTIAEKKAELVDAELWSFNKVEKGMLKAPLLRKRSILENIDQLLLKCPNSTYIYQKYAGYLNGFISMFPVPDQFYFNLIMKKTCHALEPDQVLAQVDRTKINHLFVSEIGGNICDESSFPGAFYRMAQKLKPDDWGWEYEPLGKILALGGYTKGLDKFIQWLDMTYLVDICLPNHDVKYPLYAKGWDATEYALEVNIALHRSDSWNKPVFKINP